MNLALFYYDTKRRDLADIVITDYIHFGTDLVGLLTQIDPGLNNKGSLIWYKNQLMRDGIIEMPNHDNQKGILTLVDYNGNIPEHVEPLLEKTKQHLRDSKIEDILN